MSVESGRLYIVATPIGNMEDLTARAGRILQEADLIICEKPAQTGKLAPTRGKFKKFTGRVSDRDMAEIISSLEANKKVAFVTDAGTPNLQDPASYLVRHLLRAGLPPPIPVPGPSALTAFLSILPWGGDDFLFTGFFPKKEKERERLVERWKSQALVVFYESPHRVSKTVKYLVERLGGEIPAAMGRELTKKFEQIYIGDLEGLLAHPRVTNPRGEYVLALKP